MLLLFILACVSYRIIIWDGLTAMNRIDRDNMSAILCDIYDELNPNTFDRIMAYLIIHSVQNRLEIIREDL